MRELVRLDSETPWVEFKVDNADPVRIGEYVSALANSAARVGKPAGYVVWGVSDDTHEIVGTGFRPAVMKVGNEELESWLLHLLTPKLDFRFVETDVDGRRVVLLEIPRAIAAPVQFKGIEYIRVGSYRKPLKDHPQIERELWRVFDRVPFEDVVAVEGVSSDNVVELLDVDAYYRLLARPVPVPVEHRLQPLAEDKLIVPSARGGWDITNIGAIVLARRIESFDRLNRKMVRVVRYRGKTRSDGALVEERVGSFGYAVGFEGLVGFIDARIPRFESITALRVNAALVPLVAVRELIANALIHQDLAVTGAGPMVEIFDDRVEITNPGAPLIDTQRLLDTPPRSRNERLASFMRRIGVCEERGSGVDKVVQATEREQLPAPDFRVAGDNTIATLFAARPLTDMDREDRVRAVYLHACLRYVNHETVTNTTIRDRFGIEPHNAARASRLINEAVEAGMIRARDPAAAKKLMRYVPFWA